MTHSSIRRTRARLNSGPYFIGTRQTKNQYEKAIKPSMNTTENQFKQDQLRPLVPRPAPGAGSASVTIPFFVGRDSPAFAAYFRHQPDYARSESDEPPPITEKVMVLRSFLAYRITEGMRGTLAASDERCVTRKRQRFRALGGASAIGATQFCLSNSRRNTEYPWAHDEHSRLSRGSRSHEIPCIVTDRRKMANEEHLLA